MDIPPLLAAGEQLARYQKPGLAWLNRQAEVAGELGRASGGRWPAMTADYKRYS